MHPLLIIPLRHFCFESDISDVARTLTEEASSLALITWPSTLWVRQRHNMKQKTESGQVEVADVGQDPLSLENDLQQSMNRYASRHRTLQIVRHDSCRYLEHAHVDLLMLEKHIFAMLQHSSRHHK